MLANARVGRRRTGSAVAEMPAAMYVLFLGLLVPLIGLVMFGYRAALFYFSLRNTCYQAAKSTTFTNAQTNANKAWNNNKALWSGLVSGTETTYIVTHTMAGGDSLRTTPIPTPPGIDTTNNVYFIRVNATCLIAPIWGGSWLGMSVPGLTTPFPLQLTYQDYAENPQGLTQ